MKKRLLILGFCSFFICGHGFSQVQVTNIGEDNLYEPLTHTVAYGESVYSIAKKYNLSPNDLMLWNKLDKNTILDRGKILIISPPPTAPSVNLKQANALTIPENGIHIVQYGEYPYLIARKYNISPNDLLEWNGLSEHSKLDYGDKLWLINPNQAVKKEENVAERETSKTLIPLDFVHEVKYGENIYSIAQKYGIKPNDLLQWNNLNIYSKIDKGMKLWLKSQNE